ncbi:MAG: response regulator [Candidatus Cloacimonetes bacterium]|nr:response regulator [Candidatus Cloacimonadota bacterium]
MSRKKILIVEDEQIFAHDIKDVIEEKGYEVCSIATSGDEALEDIEKYKPDMLLIDIKLTGKMDGIQLSEKINNVHPIPIIYITAYSDKKTIDEAMQTKPIAYLIKPILERELVRIITDNLK